MKKGNDLLRGVMLREQSERAGREIAHLAATVKFLARKLAALGVHPSQRISPQTSGDALDRLARAWLAEGRRVAEQGQASSLPKRQIVAQEGRAWS